MLVECVLSQVAVLLMKLMDLVLHLPWLMKLDTSEYNIH